MQDVPIVENDEQDPYPVNADTERRFYMRSSGIMKHFVSQDRGPPSESQLLSASWSNIESVITLNSA